MILGGNSFELPYGENIAVFTSSTFSNEVHFMFTDEEYKELMEQHRKELDYNNFLAIERYEEKTADAYIAEGRKNATDIFAAMNILQFALWRGELFIQWLLNKKLLIVRGENGKSN